MCPINTHKWFIVLQTFSIRFKWPKSSTKNHWTIIKIFFVCPINNYSRIWFLYCQQQPKQFLKRLNHLLFCNPCFSYDILYLYCNFISSCMLVTVIERLYIIMVDIALTIKFASCYWWSLWTMVKIHECNLFNFAISNKSDFFMIEQI